MSSSTSPSSSLSHLRPAILYDHVPTDESIHFQKQFQYDKSKQNCKNREQSEKHKSHKEEEIEYDQRRIAEKGKEDEDEDEDEDAVQQQKENHQQRSYNNIGYYVSYMVHQVSAPLAPERRTSIGTVEDSQLEHEDQGQQTDDDQNDNNTGRNHSLSFSWFFRDVVARKHNHSGDGESDGSDTAEVQARRDSAKDDANVRIDSNGRYDYERMDTILETDDNDYVFVPISPPQLTDGRRRKDGNRSVSAGIVSRAVPTSLLNVTVSLVTGLFKQILFLNNTILDLSKSAKAMKAIPQNASSSSSRQSEIYTNTSSTAVSTTVYDEQGNGLILPGECIDIDLDSRVRSSSYMSGAMITEVPDDKNGNISSCLMQEFDDGVDAVESPYFTKTYDTGDDVVGTLIVPPSHQSTSNVGSRALSLFRSHNKTGKGSVEVAASFPTTKGAENGSIRSSDCERFSTSWFGTGARSKTVMISAADLLIMEQKDAEQRRIKKQQAALGSVVHDPPNAAEDMSTELFESSNEHFDIMTTTVRSDLTTVEQWLYALWYFGKSRAHFQKRQDGHRRKCSRIARRVVDSSFAIMLRDMANEVTKVNYRNNLSPQDLLYQVSILLNRKMASYLHFDRRLFLLLETRPMRCNLQGESRPLGSDEEENSDPMVDEDDYDVVEKGEVELARLN